jgi:DNA-binding NarL/FixJ family response regulator
MTRLRILIADDHEFVRRGLRQLLEGQRGWQVVGEAATGLETVEMALKLRPKVVIMDLAMPEMTGLEATRKILTSLPKTEILVLTMHESEHFIRDVINAGARGYLLKTDAGVDLVDAVRALRDHKPFFTSKVAEMVLHGFLSGSDEAAVERSSLGHLSAREREILQLLAEGKSNKEIAFKLDVSIKTALAHRANIMHKLGLETLPDLIKYAIRNKIISM